MIVQYFHAFILSLGTAFKVERRYRGYVSGFLWKISCFFPAFHCFFPVFRFSTAFHNFGHGPLNFIGYSFNAKMDEKGGVNFNTDDVLVFDSLTQDFSEGAYDSSSGIYTAPKDGTYSFLATICNNRKCIKVSNKKCHGG